MDEDSAVRRMLLRVLDEENYSVCAARTGREALTAAAGETFHLLMLDLNLPNENGWEICQQFNQSHPSVPIIVISGRPNQLVLGNGARLGVFLEKPLDMCRLLRTIGELLQPAQHSLANSAAPVGAS